MVIQICWVFRFCVSKAGSPPSGFPYRKVKAYENTTKWLICNYMDIKM